MELLKIGASFKLARLFRPFDTEFDVGLLIKRVPRGDEGYECRFFDGIKMREWFIEADETGKVRKYPDTNDIVAHNEHGDCLAIQLIN